MSETLTTRLADLLLPARREISRLDDLIASAGKAHIAARRALAIAVAEEERESERRATLAAEAKSLEARAVAALGDGREDLANRAAEAIAVLETEVAASDAASARFAAKVALSRRDVDTQRRRLADLDRGRRLAKVGGALAGTVGPDGFDPLARAEAALARVETSQACAEAVRVAFEPGNQPLIEEMAEAGFGPATRVRPADVMTRLRALAAPAKQLPET